MVSLCALASPVIIDRFSDASSFEHGLLIKLVIIMVDRQRLRFDACGMDLIPRSGCEMNWNHVVHRGS